MSEFFIVRALRHRYEVIDHRFPLETVGQRGRRLRALHTCTAGHGSMSCRACSRGVPYPHRTVEEILDEMTR